MEKHDPNGNILWTHVPATDNSSGTPRVFDVQLDSTGNVYALSQHIISTSNYDMRLFKLDNDGNFLWEHAELNSGRGSTGMSITIDEINGLVYASTWGYDDNSIKRFNAADGTEDTSWIYMGHTDNVCDIKYVPDGFLYTGSLDGTFRKIDVSTAMPAWTIPPL